MRTVHTGTLTGLVAQLALLAALAGTVGLTPAGAVVGLAFAVVATSLLSRGLLRSGSAALGPADRITLSRAVLVGGVAALVADSFLRPVPAVAVPALAAVALVLDGVDGRVARHTGTVSRLGARFDVEVDAVLVLVLSLSAARALQPWVLLIGVPHYVLLLARRRLPWLRGEVPARYWCKVVAVVQGVTLITAAAGVLPAPVAATALAGVAVLLAESFGRETWWLWRASGRGRVPAAVADPVGAVGG